MKLRKIEKEYDESVLDTIRLLGFDIIDGAYAGYAVKVAVMDWGDLHFEFPIIPGDPRLHDHFGLRRWQARLIGEVFTKAYDKGYIKAKSEVTEFLKTYL